MLLFSLTLLSKLELRQFIYTLCPPFVKELEPQSGSSLVLSYMIILKVVEKSAVKEKKRYIHVKIISLILTHSNLIELLV